MAQAGMGIVDNGDVGIPDGLGDARPAVYTVKAMDKPYEGVGLVHLRPTIGAVTWDGFWLGHSVFHDTVAYDGDGLTRAGPVATASGFNNEHVHHVAVVIHFSAGVNLNARVPTVSYYPETRCLAA